MYRLTPLASRLSFRASLAVALVAPVAAAQTAPAPSTSGTAPAPAPPAPAPAPPATYSAPPPAPPPPPAGGYQYPYGGYPYAPYPYPYPGYPPPAAKPRPKARVLPYHQGQRIPPGYYLDRSIYRGPAIAGAVVLGAPYAISVAVASGFNFDNRSGWLAVPAIGPFITAAARHDTCPTNSDIYYNCTDDQAIRTLLVFDGLAQSAGAVLLIWALSSHHSRLVREDVTYFVVTPTRVGSGYGLGVSGRM